MIVLHLNRRGRKNCLIFIFCLNFHFMKLLHKKWVSSSFQKKNLFFHRVYSFLNLIRIRIQNSDPDPATP